MEEPFTLSLVVPCYNEENSLRGIIETTERLKIKGGLEIIIVDDCSRDKSLEVAQELQKEFQNIRVLRHEVNLGKGAALRTGFVHATGKYVGVQDADLEYNPQDYLTMLEPLESGKADVVYGSRYLRPDTRRVLYFWHTWMNKSLTKASNMFTNLDITDMETCYKLFRREVIQEIAKNLKENRFGFEPEVTALVSQGNYRVYEVAIQYHPRTFEEGKKIGWKDGVRALYCIFHYGAHSAPLPMQLIIYFFIGGISAICNVIAFAIAKRFCIEPLYFATGGAFVFAAIINYLLCVQVLFKHKNGKTAFLEMALYIFTLCVMGFVDFGCTVGLARAGLSLMWSKFWAAVVGFFGNFVLRKFLVFGRGK